MVTQVERIVTEVKKQNHHTKHNHIVFSLDDSVESNGDTNKGDCK